jgi:hypothetical protein
MESTPVLDVSKRALLRHIDVDNYVITKLLGCFFPLSVVIETAVWKILFNRGIFFRKVAYTTLKDVVNSG